MTSAQVLIIDDDPTIVQLLSMALTKTGMEVLVAPDGDAGLRLFREQTPDLAIVDISMPGIDGFDVIRQIRATGSTRAKTPVIVFTAHTMMRSYADSLGVELFLTKPVAPQQLIAHIHRLLGLPAD